ncbi:hypothetical protein F4801DRAFT_386024 [Xylaria longipes]|nr:hypothetical protein F4801DRAFT_386024 [Xylaria longipes]
MDPCDRNFTITHQTDIDDGPLVLCLGSENTNINIRNATRTLTFSNLTKTDGIDVQNSPQLEILNFPNLRRTHYIEISQATSLTNVSFPRLRNCSGINNLPFFDLTINGTRSLKSFALPDSSCIKNLVLSDIRPSNWTALDPDWTVSPEFASWNISDALDVYIDACIPLSSLKSALNLGISVQDCGFGLDELTSVANFSLANVTGSSFLSAPLQIQENMLLESSIRLDSVYFAENPSYVQADSIPLDLVGTIGGDLNITSNGNLHIAYDNLTEVGKSLSIRNNTNCTFNFDKFSVVNTLIFADNVDTKLPQFISLERAQNIHIHGLMDLSTGPNILPALIDVAGNVTVEPWNDDFDCSKLVSQWKDQIIHNLKCNGRNNETETPAPKSDNGTNTPIPTSSQSLPSGAWAGIGVGAGVVTIGILGALIWLIIHFRNQLRTLERERVQESEENESSKEPEQQHIFQMQEVCGRGIFREKPDDHLIELSTQPAELPTRPHSWAGTESGEAGRAL